MIGLVDKMKSDLDIAFDDCIVIEVEEIAISGFENMIKQYTIVELLTSVKPFYIEWLFNNYPAVENVVYFDPDIMIFQPLARLEESLKHNDIILTPHFTTPINDAALPAELHVMQTGIFNLGFIAVRRSSNGFRMLEWWQSRLKNQCIIDLSKGLFVDQLWANLIPAYFDNVLIEKYPAYNMAHWNLHERRLQKTNDIFYVNEVPLVFFHFSHYSPLQPNSIAGHHTRFNFDTRPELAEIFSLYKDALARNYYFELRKQPCFYLNNEKKKMRKRAVETFLRTALPDKLKGKLKSLLAHNVF